MLISTLANESKLVKPRLMVFVQLEDGVAVDASLSPASRALLQKLASKAPVVENGAVPQDDSTTTDKTDEDSAPV